MTTETRDDRPRNRRWDLNRIPRPLKWIGIALLVAVVFVGFGHFMRWLWAETVTDIFGVRQVSFWEMWGVILLCWLLFKANVSTNSSSSKQGS